MVTQEKLQEHITKAKVASIDAEKKSGDNKYDLEARKARKKLRRLTRKNAKIDYAKKKSMEKGKKKKNDG
tara:strand:- start:1272 stop:1481 length:210 start_codon:yes stop_codon:yes gene_type:complete